MIGKKTLSNLDDDTSRRIAPDVREYIFKAIKNDVPVEDLDANAAEIPHKDPSLSLILVLPGRQREFLAGALPGLERRLLASTRSWSSLLRCLRPLNLSDLRLPALRHRSTLELRPTLEALGVTDAFEAGAADFAGVNGDSNDLWLSSFAQLNEFRFGRGDEDDDDDVDDKGARSEEVGLLWRLFSSRRRQKRQSEEGEEDKESSASRDEETTKYRLHFNRQFLYVLRHNPTGMILHMGRYYQPPSDEGHHHEEQHHGGGHHEQQHHGGDDHHQHHHHDHHE